MLFYRFKSQEERRKCGGSAFIEIQFCRLPAKTNIKELVAVNNINHWKLDSLYIKDENLFYREYSSIFDCGIYGNLKSGIVDIFGINYYAPSQIDSLINSIRERKPIDHEVLIDWINRTSVLNGFYILGM